MTGPTVGVFCARLYPGNGMTTVDLGFIATEVDAADLHCVASQSGVLRFTSHWDIGLVEAACCADCMPDLDGITSPPDTFDSRMGEGEIIITLGLDSDCYRMYVTLLNENQHFVREQCAI